MKSPSYPMSLIQEILARSFHAPNGEIGVLHEDIMPFLSACQQDLLAILGWEAWIVDHQSTAEGIKASNGQWAGLLPLKDSLIEAVYHGETSPQSSESWAAYVQRCINDTKQQIEGLNVQNEIKWQYKPFLRFNFTLESDAT